VRPDQDSRLTSMGKGEPTCDLCFQFYPGGSETDDVCDDCKLNPMETEGGKTQFIKDATDRVENTPIEEIERRVLEGSR